MERSGHLAGGEEEDEDGGEEGDEEGEEEEEGTRHARTIVPARVSPVSGLGLQGAGGGHSER